MTQEEYAPKEIIDKAEEVYQEQKARTWRCLNNHLFGYCSGEPDFEVEPTANDSGDFRGGKCKNNYKKCIKYRMLSEMIDLSSLPESHLVETFTPPEEKEPKKEKATKAAKPKKENIQASF